MFQVISTVVMVSSDEVSVYEAAMALRPPSAPKQPIVPCSPVTQKPANGIPENGKPFRRIGTFRPEPWSKKKRSLTRKFTRSMTMPIQSLGKRFFGLTCLRGLNPFLIMSVAQWYLGAISDFFLSGQPKELMPGYGSSSVILAIFFGGGSALWTHYAITEPSNRDIYKLFPRGSDILVELFPITCLWAVCEQITMSLPLAMSRSRFFELREYAWSPALWSDLDASNQRLLLFKFSLVYIFYLLLVACFSIPASMMLRRIHASMLPEADAAIVPYVRGKPQPRDDEDSPTYSPGLSVGEAWSTLKWSAYCRVLRVFIQYFIINQLLRFLCWEADWRLHEFFETDQYTSPFPSGSSKLALRLFER